jgi:hypothetical protein
VNLIEMAFSKLKALLQQAPVRTVMRWSTASSICSITFLSSNAPTSFTQQDMNAQP